MTTIVTRAGKGSPLTNNEVDANFVNLNDAKIETLTSTDSSVTITGTGDSRDLSVPINPNAVSGPASATDNAITRFDGTTGKLVQNSTVTLDDNGNVESVNAVVFDTTPGTLPTAPGSLYWDSADGNQTLSLIMANGDATQQIGEEMYFRIKASAPITEGQVVMFTGTVGASGALTGAPAAGLTAATASYVMGIATHSLALNEWGYVTNFGLVRNLNTAAWPAGTILYYDPTLAGSLTNAIPDAPTAKVQVCAVVYQSPTAGALFVRPSFGGILGQYEGDVGLGAYADGQLLVRDQTSGKWVNANLTAGAAISVTNGAGSVTITNTAPDQVVSLTQGGTTTITGTYPNFTISSDDQFDGTVTDVSGTGPINVATGTTTPVVSIDQANTTTDGYLSSTDWNTFNDKYDIPSQTGNTGKYLTTDGSITSWGTVDALPSQTGNEGKFLTTDGSIASWAVPDAGGTVETFDFTATAGQTVITVNYTVGATEVYQNGVKLGLTDFTATNGTSITLTTAAAAGDLLEVVTFTALNLYSVITEDSFSGDGTTTGFTMSAVPANAASALIVISGVTQDPSSYTVLGNALTFSVAPPTGTDNISVRYLGLPSVGTVSSFSGGTTGLTPATATLGAVTLGGTLATTNGGTGLTTVGTNGQVLTSNGTALTWSTPSAGTSFSAGTTGLTPNTPTTGTVTLGGTLGIANGGTNATTAAAALTSLGAYPATNPNGYTNNTGTVTSVSGTGTVSGISLSGTVTGSGNLTLGGALSVSSANLPAGTVLQVQQAALTSAFTSSSSSWTNWTGLSVSITPSSAANKILVMLSSMVTNDTSNTWQMVKVVRNGSDMVIGDAVGAATRCWIDGSFGTAQNANWGRTLSAAYLDSPGVSSSITYQAQVIVTNGGTAYWGRSASTSDQNRSTVPSTLIVMEIKG